MISTKNKAAQLFSILLITIRNVSWAANQYIGIISEESRDTEDWSNDAENSALHHRLIPHLKKDLNRKLFEIIIFHNITVLTIFMNKFIQSWWAYETKKT